MFNTIVLLIFLACLVGFLFFTKSGKRLRLRASGTADEVASKDAASPTGAKSYYNTAISKKEESYKSAFSIYTQMLGKIETYENQLRNLKKENMQLDINIDNCISKNDDSGAKVYLIRRQEIKDKIEIIREALKELNDNAAVQKEILDNLNTELDDLKAEKEKAVLILETAQVTKSLQATPGVSTSEEDKMLEKVREGIQKTKEEGIGNKIAYENSASVQQKRLDNKMKEDEIQKQLDQLKAAKRK